MGKLRQSESIINTDYLMNGVVPVSEISNSMLLATTTTPTTQTTTATPASTKITSLSSTATATMSISKIEISSLNYNDEYHADVDENKSQVINNNKHVTKEFIALESIVTTAPTATTNLINKTKIDYRAEGNANLVLALSDSKQVLRIRKSNINEIEFKDKNDHKTLSLCIEYIKFISTLIGSHFTNAPKLVNIILSDYTEFNKWLQINRPVERLNKNIQCHYAMLYPDVAFLPTHLSNGIKYQVNNEIDTFCIEIKPKQGWTFYGNDLTDVTNKDLITNGYILNNNNNNNNNNYKCRFCSMQYLKLHKNVISKISEYCPIDLFSGNISRMYRAIIGLIQTPQNNFRIFKNGKLIYKNETDLCKIYTIINDLFDLKMNFKENKFNFILLLIKALLNDFSTTKDSDNLKEMIHKEEILIDNQIPKCQSINSKINNLPDNCILKRVLNVQLLAKSLLLNPSVDQMVDDNSSTINISNNDDHNNFNKYQQQHQQQQQEQQIDQYSYINNILNKVNCNIDCCKNDDDDGGGVGGVSGGGGGGGGVVVDGDIKKYLESLNDTEKYLLGATALDCSIMLAFQRLPNNYDEIESLNELHQKHIINVNGINFITKLTAMDLDPKSKQHFGKYIRQTNASNLAYQKSLQSSLN